MSENKEKAEQALRRMRQFRIDFLTGPTASRMEFFEVMAGVFRDLQGKVEEFEANLDEALWDARDQRAVSGHGLRGHVRKAARIPGKKKAARRAFTGRLVRPVGSGECFVGRRRSAGGGGACGWFG